MVTYLDAILAHHRRRAAADRRDVAALEAAALAAPDRRDFTGSLIAGSRQGGIALIAEIKRRSPSRGDFDEIADPARLALRYEAGGASALSVLTDGPHFGGSAADLVAARSATRLPALRKDFTITIADVYDARLMGADAVLLIVAALDDLVLATTLGAARRVGLAALVEIHDELELARALEAGAELIGVNQRDLRTFEVDTERAVRVAASIPAEIVTVAESGVSDTDQVARLADAGFDAILVGEALVTNPDPAAEIARLRHGALAGVPTTGTTTASGSAV